MPVHGSRIQRHIRMARIRRRRLAAFMVMALSGGTLFGTCMTRIHDSIINGTELFILSLLDPSNVVIE